MKQIFLTFLTLILLCFLPLQSVEAKSNKQVVTFYVQLHCQGCIDKVYKTIAYERGVKDLKCDLQNQTVQVTYDANKTDVPALQKAFADMGKPAFLTREEMTKHHSSHGNH